jgi:hypothetical protein
VFCNLESQRHYKSWCNLECTNHGENNGFAT